MKTQAPTPALCAVLHLVFLQCVVTAANLPEAPLHGPIRSLPTGGPITGPAIDGSRSSAGTITVTLNNVSSQSVTEAVGVRTAGTITVYLDNISASSITVGINISTAGSINVHLNNIAASTIRICPNIVTSGPITVYRSNIADSVIIVGGNVITDSPITV